MALGKKTGGRKKGTPNRAPRQPRNLAPEQEALERDAYYRRVYGISLADYECMAEAQGKRCAACGEEWRGERRLHVDHDHTSGRVRGLLCQVCNVAAGYIESGRFGKVAAYLGLQTTTGNNAVH